MSTTVSRSSTSQSFTKSSIRQNSIQVNPISGAKPEGYSPSHHVNSPPTSFKNPWPSSPAPHSLASVLYAKFFNNAEKNFVPVPTDRSLLVPIEVPDWGASDPNASSKLRATWIGHASFLAEFPSTALGRRGVRVLLDPVFSDRTSPVSFLGPKRFRPPCCKLEELPVIDVVCISHNHYDHLDVATIKYIHSRGQGNVRFLCGLGVGANLAGMGVTTEEIVEMDWWDSVEINVEEDGIEIGRLNVVCTPSQHMSGRGISDHGKTLWCSFALQEILSGSTGKDGLLNQPDSSSATPEEREAVTATPVGKKLYFAGDTAYRAIPQGASEEEISRLPVCPAFSEVGKLYGPFDLALLPIGCYSPRWWMSAVHCAPEDSICIHKDIKSRKSIGMHYGTLRGGISQYYEEVTEPPKRWKEACETAGLRWLDEIGVCSIGGTILV